MALHIIKLCVGAENIADLAHWQRRVSESRRLAGQKALPTCETRNTPKRAQEILAGGSLFWVIKGLITVRQSIVDIETLNAGGAPVCVLELDPALVRVESTPKRPFQGWRYLEAHEAPQDLHSRADIAKDSAAKAAQAAPTPAALRKALLDAGVW
jgi:hypothetical protein